MQLIGIFKENKLLYCDPLNEKQFILNQLNVIKTLNQFALGIEQEFQEVSIQKDGISYKLQCHQKQGLTYVKITDALTEAKYESFLKMIDQLSKIELKDELE